MKAQWIVVIILVLLIVLYLSRNKIKSAMTRGYRNNNPGNLEDKNDGTDVWIGQKPKSTDPPFKQFVSMPFGYRALFINLRGAIHGGFNTIQSLITRYAPPGKDKNVPGTSANNTAAYIAFVSKMSGKKPTDVLNFTDTATMRKIVAAISQQENGIPADMADVDEGYKLLHV